jgi:hypothetical protein
MGRFEDYQDLVRRMCRQEVKELLESASIGQVFLIALVREAENKGLDLPKHLETFWPAMD